MLQPRHSGELELGRRAERDVQSFDIASLDVTHGNPCVQRFEQSGTGLDGAQIESERESGNDHQKVCRAGDESMHLGRPSLHRSPLPRFHHETARPHASSGPAPDCHGHDEASGSFAAGDRIHRFALRDSPSPASRRFARC